MTVRNLHWELETTFTRKQVIAMSKVSDFTGNIEAELKKGFPTSSKEIDWDSFREVMTLFDELGRQDRLMFKALCQTVSDVNAGKVQILCGKVVPVESKEAESD